MRLLQDVGGHLGGSEVTERAKLKNGSESLAQRHVPRIQDGLLEDSVVGLCPALSLLHEVLHAAADILGEVRDQVVDLGGVGFGIIRKLSKMYCVLSD